MGRMSDASIRVTANLFSFNRSDWKPHTPDGRAMNVPFALLMWGYYGGQIRATLVDGRRHLFNRVMRQEALDVDVTAEEAGHGERVRVARADELFDDSWPFTPERIEVLADLDTAVAIATAAGYASTAMELTTVRRDLVDG